MRRLASLALAGLLWAGPARAFANVPIGALVENDVLPALSGGEMPLLGETNVSVFIFFKPGTEHSNQAMAQIARLEKELAGKPIHWCAIVSDRVPKAEVETAVRESGLAMPILVDRGDALYGKLGAFLHPVVGITDGNHRLAAYQPFAKVNFAAVIRAQILRALNEISDEELAAVLQPVAVQWGGETSVAHRYLRLAEKQFQATNYAQAMTNIQKSLEKNPTAEAYVLQGKILLGRGSRAEALMAFEAALKLDPQNTNALAGSKSCQQP